MDGVKGRKKRSDLPNFAARLNYGELISNDTGEYKGRRYVIDAFGHGIYYRCPGAVNTRTYDLHASGVEVFDTGDDISYGPISVGDLLSARVL